MSNYDNYCYAFSPIYSQIPMTPAFANDRFYLIEYFKKYLMQKAMSVYKWKMPKLWSKDYFLYTLYIQGFCSVLYTVKYGWIPQRCTLSGYDLFEEPNGIMINNTFVQATRKIGDTCVLFKFNPDYTGVADIINEYACSLAEMWLTMYANLQSTKVGFVLTANDKNEAESMKKVVDQIMDGEVASIVKKTNVGTWDYFSNNVKQNYVVSDLIIDMRKLLNSFNTEFGIPNANTEKKERMVIDEVNSNNGDTKSRAEIWLDRFKETCKELNSMAGESLMSVEWNKVLDGGGTNVQTTKQKSE